MGYNLVPVPISNPSRQWPSGLDDFEVAAATVSKNSGRLSGCCDEACVERVQAVVGGWDIGVRRLYGVHNFLVLFTVLFGIVVIG